MGVVIDLPPRHEGCKIGGKLGHIQTGDKTGEVVGVGANVPCGAPCPGSGRICAPLGLLEILRLGEPILRVFDLHHADFADLSGGDHLSCLPHHGVARVVVREDKKRV